MSAVAAASLQVALAKAERLAGQHVASETILRHCRVSFPSFAPAAAALADLLVEQGRHAEALTAWQDVIAAFMDVVQPWWLLELAKAERRIGQELQAEASLQRCRARFPAFGPAAAAQADLLAGQGRHAEALSAWQAVIAEFGASVQPWWLLELAKAERRNGQLRQAEVRLQQCRTVFPAFGPAAAALADLWEEQGRHAEALSAWHSVIADFPESVQPWWLVELAKAELRNGQVRQAEARLQHCRSRFPAFGPAAATLADVLGGQGRYMESLAAWTAAFIDFSAIARPWWFRAFAASWQATGQVLQAQSVMTAMDARFPDLPDAAVRRAEAAATNEDWAKAYDYWTEHIARHHHEVRPHWLNGQASALFRSGRIEEALEAWTHLNLAYPDYVAGRLSRAAAAAELGQWAIANQHLSDLIDRNPHGSKPNWLVDRVRALLFQRLEQQAKDAIDEVTAKFPDSPHGLIIAVEYCYYMQFGMDVILPAIEAAVRRFPQNRSLLAEYVRALLATGRQDHAAAVVDSMESSADDHYALISRWRLIADQNAEGALEEAAHRAVRSRRWQPQSGLTIGNFLASLLWTWAIELAQALFDRLASDFPGRAAIMSAQARTLVMLRQDDRALQSIAAIHTAYRTNEVLELRAWASAQRGDLERAQHVWQMILSQLYCPALHGPAPNLQKIASARTRLPLGGVTTFVKIRNEMAQLPSFLQHHRDLGVGHFVFIDNMSTDEGSAYLSRQPDVTLYRTTEVFQTSSAGMRWINLLRERYGQHGWCLHADADERLVYPGWETARLDQLIAYFDCEGADGVAGFMLDLYPDKLVDGACGPASHADYCYYDNDYNWIGQTRAPYIQPVGGVRQRLFGAAETLHKTPLIRDCRSNYINSHNTTPLRLSGLTVLLLHYKLLNLTRRFQPSGRANGVNPFMANRSPEIMRRHVRYVAEMASILDAALVKPEFSETLTDSMALADRGLMQAPTAWREWLHHRRGAG